jgi:hypothetical protein
VSRLVTLLTDFGHTDSYVAEMKAALLRGAPAAVLVDITHEIPPGDVGAAQYLLGRSWRWFPEGTVHLAVVDPGVGTARRALAASSGGHGFVAPDNGLLSFLPNDAPIVELPVPEGASPTFHGRDLFAPAAARLACGAPLAALGSAVHDAYRSPIPAPRPTEGGGAIGAVIHVDRFGTLVTNLDSGSLERRQEVVVTGRRVPVRSTFGDVDRGALVAFLGSGGTLEIAMRDGSAAEALGAGVGTEVRTVGSRE